MQLRVVCFVAAKAVLVTGPLPTHRERPQQPRACRLYTLRALHARPLCPRARAVIRSSPTARAARGDATTQRQHINRDTFEGPPPGPRGSLHCLAALPCTIAHPTARPFLLCYRQYPTHNCSHVLPYPAISTSSTDTPITHVLSAYVLLPCYN